MKYSAKYTTPVGNIVICYNDKALTGLWFEGQKHFPKHLTDKFIANNIYKQTITWINRYFSGESPSYKTITIIPNGTDFQKKVWKLLLNIPYGKTKTYKEIASAISPNMSAQAVGNAVGKNPISIIIPCHRVIGANGKLSGYAGGIEKKEFLLNFESRHKKGQ